MATYLFAVVVSFFANFILIVPFIDLLYNLKLRRPAQQGKDILNKPTPVFNRFHLKKTGTPVGGGILLLITTVLIYLLFIFTYFFIYKKIPSNYPSVIEEIKIILFTFVFFSFLGIFDDLNKIFFWKKNQQFGLRIRQKLIFETILALIVGYWLYSSLKIKIIYIPFFGVFDIGVFYILFAAFVIVAFSNAVNITDGLDGLASGVLMIALSAFWVTFAVIGLILGKSFSLIVIGGIFVIEIASSFIQIFGKKILKRKILPVAPLHLWLQLKGWEEPKIVMRFWIISVLFAVFGLMIAFMK